MKRVFLALCILSIALFSCSSTADELTSKPQASPTARIETLDAFESALSVAATSYDPQGEIELFEGLHGRRYEVNGENLVALQAQPDLHEAALEAVLSGISGESSAPIKHWRSGQLAVVYEGSDGGLILLLSGLLGDPQAAEPPAHDEPYPPAVLAAISQVSERNNFAPAEVEVLSFESAQWPDSCLGMPRSDESCAGDPVPGWRIHLQVDNRSWQAHTDEFGQRVRLR